MRSVPRQHSTPELAVRKILSKAGYRYRLHRKDLPGTPDIVFPSRRVALFINGCFWHLHADCPKGRPPASNTDYWLPKLKRNRERDIRNVRALRASGWRVVTVWECEIDRRASLLKKLVSLLGR